MVVEDQKCDVIGSKNFNKDCNIKHSLYQCSKADLLLECTVCLLGQLLKKHT